MKALGEQHIEHGRRVGRDLLIAADKADAVALANLLAGARHRRFQKAQAVSDAVGECGDPIRVAGRGAEHDLARSRGQQRSLDDLFDLISVEHGEHDRIAFFRDLRDRSGAAADLPKTLALRRIDIEADDREACRHQPARVDFAHEAEADDADGGLWRHRSFLFVASLLAMTMYELFQRRDVEVTRQRIEAFAQRLRYGHPAGAAIHQLGVALLARQPDALDTGQPA